MWINAGIDSGDLITTERTPLHGRESLIELHLKVMGHAHELYIRAVDYFVAGKEINGVPQSSLPSHRLYLTKDWNSSSQVRALINFRFFTTKSVWINCFLKPQRYLYRSMRMTT